MRQVFVDTETTGLFTKDGHRVIEFACVEMVDRKLTGRVLHEFVNPGRPIDEGAFKCHGISDEMVKDKPPFAKFIPELKDFLKDSEVIMHNAQFDCEHINNELRIAKAGWELKDICIVKCTLRMAWAQDKVWMVKGYSLDKLREQYRVDTARDKHGALLDASILAEVYLRFTSQWYM